MLELRSNQLPFRISARQARINPVLAHGSYSILHNHNWRMYSIIDPQNRKRRTKERNQRIVLTLPTECVMMYV